MQQCPEGVLRVLVGRNGVADRRGLAGNGGVVRLDAKFAPETTGPTAEQASPEQLLEAAATTRASTPGGCTECRGAGDSDKAGTQSVAAHGRA